MIDWMPLYYWGIAGMFAFVLMMFLAGSVHMWQVNKFGAVKSEIPVYGAMTIAAAICYVAAAYFWKIFT